MTMEGRGRCCRAEGLRDLVSVCMGVRKFERWLGVYLLTSLLEEF